MPAMHDIVYDCMVSRLGEKRDIFLRTLHFDMTHHECLALVAPKEHHEILIRASEVAAVENTGGIAAVMELTVPALIDGVAEPTVYLCMRTHAERTPPLRPRYPQWQPGQAGTKVIEWLTKRLEIGRRFGMARHVLYRLKEDCDSGHQLRYMFPQVLSLCSVGVHEKMDRWLEKHAAYKPCRHTPAVSRAFKNAIMDASALLTSSTLIGEDVPENPPGYVEISVDYELPSFQMDGHSIRRI